MAQTKITIFTKDNCPKCPKARHLLEELNRERPLDVREVNIGTPDGMFEAVQYNLMSTPSLILQNGRKEVKIISGSLDKQKLISALEDLAG